MYCVCVCIALQYLQTCSYTGNTPSNLWNSKQFVRKINSRYYQLDRKQNVHLHHTQTRQAKYSIGNSSKSLVSTMQNISQVPITIYDRNFGHYIPAVLLHWPQTHYHNSKTSLTSADFYKAIHITAYSDKGD